MKLAIGFDRSGADDWDEAAAFVIEAERMGVACAWTAEAWGQDAVTPLGFMAAKTTSIKLGSGIMQISARTPAMAAMTALTLASLSKGRFIMGLGASGPQVVEGWHGQPFGQTVTRLREYIEIVRMAIRGERVAYQGKIFTLPRPGGQGKAIRTSAAPRNDIPIYLATLSPKSLELTGEVADGWVGTSFIPEHADVFFDHIARGAARAGRSLADIDLQAAGGVIAFGDDVERLVAPRRPGLAFTLGAMGSKTTNFYNDAFKRAGYADEASEVQRLWVEGKRDEAISRVPDEMVLGTNLIGTAAMVKDRIRAHKGAGVTTLRVSPDGATLAERIENLGRVSELIRAVEAE
jgi:F420-dependent oxidoreductase-like protein